MSNKTHKEKRNLNYIPKKAADFSYLRSRKEAERLAKLKEKYDSKNDSIPPLSQAEKEHLTYLRVLEQYNDLKEKRYTTRRYGSIAIIVSAIIFITMIFSLETKIEFLGLWVVIVVYCVVIMIRSEYRYHNFKELLGAADEFDYYELESEDDEEEITFREVLKSMKPNLPRIKRTESGQYEEEIPIQTEVSEQSDKEVKDYRITVTPEVSDNKENNNNNNSAKKNGEDINEKHN